MLNIKVFLPIVNYRSYPFMTSYIRYSKPLYLIIKVLSEKKKYIYIIYFLEKNLFNTDVPLGGPRYDRHEPQHTL